MFPVGRPVQHQVQQVQHVQVHPQDNPNEKHFRYKINDRLDFTTNSPNGRYTIVNTLGSGAYGKVLECSDEERSAVSVAIKTVRSEEAYTDAAKREIRSLESSNHPNVVAMLHNFVQDGHVCIVMEMLRGGSLFERLYINRLNFAMHEMRSMAHQMIVGLAHIHERGMVHADIKSDNIMLHGFTPNRTPHIKIVDLGSAVIEDDQKAHIVCSQGYRPPEVSLQTEWWTPIDTWGMGCCIFELFARRRLFECDDDLAALHMAERVVQSKIPSEMIQQGLDNLNEYNEKLLTNSGTLARLPQRGVASVMASQPLTAIVKDQQLLSLVRRMVALNPAHRHPPSSLTQHAFFASLNQQSSSPEPPAAQSQTGNSARRGGSTAALPPQHPHAAPQVAVPRGTAAPAVHRRGSAPGLTLAPAQMMAQQVAQPGARRCSATGLVQVPMQAVFVGPPGGRRSSLGMIPMQVVRG